MVAWTIPGSSPRLCSRRSASSAAARVCRACASGRSGPWSSSSTSAARSASARSLARSAASIACRAISALAGKSFFSNCVWRQLEQGLARGVVPSEISAAPAQEPSPRRRSPTFARSFRRGDQLGGRRTPEVLHRLVGWTQLGPVPIRLLEVVAEDLLVLGQALAAPHARASPRTAGAGRRVAPSASPRYAASRIRRWRKRNASSPANSARSGRISSLRARASSRVGTCGRSRSGVSVVTARRVEDLALDRPAFDHGAFLGVQPVQAGGEQQLDRRRHGDVREILDRAPRAVLERAGARRRSACRASPRRTAGCPRRPRGSWLGRRRGCPRGRAGCRPGGRPRRPRAVPSRIVVAFIFPPPQSGRSSSSSGRATHRSRSGASRVQSARCSTSSRKLGSAQWMSSNTHTSGRSWREVLEELADAPAARPRPRPARPTTSKPATSETMRSRSSAPSASVASLDRAVARSSVRSTPGGLLHDLDEREVRDALAVGQAPCRAGPSPGPRSATNSCDQPGLAHAGGPEEREQVRRPLGDHAVERAGRASRALVPPDHRRVQVPGVSGRILQHHVEPGRAAPARPCPSGPSGSTGVDLDGVAARAGSVLSPSRISPGAAACSSRAATFTASPVTRR